MVLDRDLDGVEAVLPAEVDAVVRRDVVEVDDDLLDLARVDVHAADDEQVVDPAGDVVHPLGRSAALAGLLVERRDVAGPVADGGQALRGERREHELALLALGEDLAGVGVDDLGVEVVLPDVQPALDLGALDGDARADDLGEAVDVDGRHAQRRFDLLAHRVGERLGADDDRRDGQLADVDPARCRLLGEVQAVRRGTRERVALEVL